MYKLIVFTVAIIIMSINIVDGQKNVGIGTTTPATSAILELSSDNSGFLVPRMNTTERTTNIKTPIEEGLLVYDTDTKSFWYYSGSQWHQLNSGYAPEKTITASYSITPSDFTLFANVSSNMIITLPDINAVPSGKIYIIKAINLLGSLSVATQGTDKIDGQSSYTFSTQYETLKVQSDGSNWWIIK